MVSAKLMVHYMFGWYTIKENTCINKIKITFTKYIPQI